MAFDWWAAINLLGVLCTCFAAITVIIFMGFRKDPRIHEIILTAGLCVFSLSSAIRSIVGEHTITWESIVLAALTGALVFNISAVRIHHAQVSIIVLSMSLVLLSVSVRSDIRPCKILIWIYIMILLHAMHVGDVDTESIRDIKKLKMF